MNAISSALQIASQPMYRTRKADGGSSSVPSPPQSQSLMPALDQLSDQMNAAQAAPSPNAPQSQSLMPALDQLSKEMPQDAPTTAPQPQQFRRTSSLSNTAGGGLLSAIGNGAKEGFGDQPFGVSSQTQASLQKSGITPPSSGDGTPMQVINKAAIDTVTPWAQLAGRTLSGAFSGAQAGVADIGKQLGAPGLGNDLAAMPEAFMGDSEFNTPKSNALEKHPEVTPSDVPNQVPSVAAPSGLPLPAPGSKQSVGAAATPGDIANMSPKEYAAMEASDNLRRLGAGPQSGDKTIYVPGSTPTAADIAGDPDISLEEKYYRQNIAPKDFDAKDAVNNEARVNHFMNLAGNPTITQTMEDARDQKADSDLAATWKNKKSTDAQPAIDFINNTLASPQGKSDAVVNSLNKVKSKLFDADGNLETDPEMLYGVRKTIGQMLSKTATSEDRDAQLASSQLIGLRRALDKTIENGAPGFADYLKNYSDASKPIDAMNYLQTWQPRLINSSGRMSTAQVHSMMKNITDQRQMPGVRPAKAIDPATLDQLWDLHSDVTRMNNRTLGKPVGSDTSQNFNVGKMIAGKAGHLAAHTVAGHVAPGIGNMAVEAVKGIAGNHAAAKAAAQQQVRKGQLLNPDLGGQ